MSRATPHALELAKRLIAAETRKREPLERELPAAFHVCELLRPRFATLMGTAGFRAILARALSLVLADAPRLEVLEVQPDGSLGGWEKPEARAHPKKLAEGTVFLVAVLLELMIVFIGDSLTRRLLRDVWPTLDFEDSNNPPGDHP